MLHPTLGKLPEVSAGGGSHEKSHLFAPFIDPIKMRPANLCAISLLMSLSLCEIENPTAQSYFCPFVFSLSSSSLFPC
jgi:hypothetical protein